MQDLLVIGGGVVGMFCAAEAVRRGLSVSLVSGPPSRPTASWAGGGILSPLFPWRYPDELAPLTVSAMQRYSDWQRLFEAASIDAPEINTCGLWVETDEIDAARRWAGRHGVNLVVEPDAVLLEDVAAIRNPQLLRALAAYLVANRVRVLADTVEALSVHDATVTIGDELLQARHVIVAAGAWSAALLPDAVTAKLPELYPAKGQMLLYPAVNTPPGRIMLTESGYLIPRKDGLVLAGSTLEPGVSDMRPTAAAAQSLSAMAARLWPALSGVSPIAQWTGLRPGSSSRLPVIRPVDTDQRVWVASGHFRNGLVAAPATAALLLDQIQGVEPFCDPAPYQSSSSELSSSASFCSR